MISKNTTREQLDQALSNVSKMFDNNIAWRRSPEAKNNAGTRFGFTLRAIDSKGKGGRVSGYRLNKDGSHARVGQSACWHAHGYFFEELFKIAPEAVIKAGSLTISAEGGNWQDRNIGSMIAPFYYSEACKCDN